jgi:hypothetical protein
MFIPTFDKPKTPDLASFDIVAEMRIPVEPKRV